MMKVGLYGAQFFARHGYYKEEQLLGNYFTVTIEADFDTGQILINDELENTLNYEKLYYIAARQMKITRQLLETVAQGIADAVMQQFPYIITLRVEVKKLNPPLKGAVAASGVTIVIGQGG